MGFCARGLRATALPSPGGVPRPHSPQWLGRQLRSVPLAPSLGPHPLA